MVNNGNQFFGGKNTMRRKQNKFKKTPLQALKLWVNALKSGRYKQGKERLCYIGENGKYRYCCLGVAKRLYEKYENNNKYIPYPLSNTLAFSGEIVAKWLNIDAIGKYPGGSLMDDNDQNNRSFNEIADIIEEHFIKPKQKRKIKPKQKRKLKK